jgi:hypothetical protein
MSDHPDVYADGVTITVNPAGLALTFTRSDPATPGVNDTERLVIAARIRLSRPVAEAIRDTLTAALASPETKGTVSH